MDKKSLFNVILTEEERLQTILHNLLLMLSRRIFIKDGEKKQLITMEGAEERIVDKGYNIYTLETDNYDNYAMIIIFQKITAIGKQSIVSDFFKDYSNFKKILVASDYNNKTLSSVLQNHSQIFRESTMMIDIISNEIQPKFELLSPEEMKRVKEEYHITDYTIPKLLKTDPVAKYFGLKKGEIIRIVRPSQISGLSISYRIVS
jgi:DNA-directed RNA polymerase subunit H (RpoH/RPB5)